MGDAWVSSEGALFTLDMAALYSKWIRDMFDEQALNPAGPNQGCVPDIVPGEWPATPGSCGAAPWAIAAVAVPYNLFRHTGDLDIVDRFYTPMRRFMDWPVRCSATDDLL